MSKLLKEEKRHDKPREKDHKSESAPSCEIACKKTAQVNVGRVLSTLCEQLQHLNVDISTAFGELISGATVTFELTAIRLVVPALVALEQAIMGFLAALQQLLCALIENPCCLSCCCLKLLLCTLSEAIAFVDAVRTHGGNTTLPLSALLLQIEKEFALIQQVLKQLPISKVDKEDKCCAAVSRAAYNVFVSAVSVVATSAVTAINLIIANGNLMVITVTPASILTTLSTFSSQLSTLPGLFQNPGCAMAAKCAAPRMLGAVLQCLSSALNCVVSDLSTALANAQVSVTPPSPAAVAFTQLVLAMLFGAAEGAKSLSTCSCSKPSKCQTSSCSKPPKGKISKIGKKAKTSSCSQNTGCCSSGCAIKCDLTSISSAIAAVGTTFCAAHITTIFMIVT